MEYGNDDRGLDPIRAIPDQQTGSLAAWLQLVMVAGIGPILLRDLVAHFGSPDAVLAAAPSQLREVPGVGPKLARAISTADPAAVQAELERCRAADIRILTQGDGDFPAMLREIPDPPGLIYLRGQLTTQDRLAVAMVGTRHATAYGLRQAERLAAGLARAGITIVSGLARGVDAAAHRAALRAGGRTIAVLASGLLEIYPPQHAALAMEISGGRGAVISESSTLGRPLRGAFPRRNRLITGLSHGTVVVEAGLRSGALISARHAMEQGREVFAVPGCVDNRAAHGCHRLLRDGAKLVETVDDVLEELGPLFQPAADDKGREIYHPGELQLNEQERQVLDAIESMATSIDEVITRCGLPVHRVLSTLSVLEMRRLVRRVSGNSVVRS